MKTYRIGGVGAMMDEYERAATDLISIVNGISDGDFVRLRDPQTTDPDCRSIQTIMNHVVASGYGYADYIRNAFGVPSERPPASLLDRTRAMEGLTRMLEYTAFTLEGRWTYSFEQMGAVRIDSRWGVRYDMEQMLEHAIVHILRHRRQIERFLGR
ncbi:MAG TPA: DinB family protein [Bacteroidota bacterium]|nr:DinB family protein [Bacteroidota bacterium]